MIDLEYEKNRKLSTQDMYDIVSFAADASYDNGFLNEFIFERALYVFSAIVFYSEDKEELVSVAAKNINDAWDKIVEEGILDKMKDEYEIDLDKIADIGKIWFEDYREYTLSARGLLNNLQEFSGDIIKNAMNQLKKTSQEEGISQVLELADKWGMNNGIGTPEEKLDMPGSVFE